MQPGPFQMGSPEDDDEALPGKRPPHPVRITRAFKMARHEVTFAEYDRFAYATGARPPSDSGFGEGLSPEERARLPAINVSFDEPRAYAKWLSREIGKRFRLPTEAEWEYAVRVGTTHRRFWGDEPSQACTYANVFDTRNEAALRAMYGANITWEPHRCPDPYPYTAPVGSFQANPWGLHDLLGNVFEWVEDRWHKDYTGAHEDGSTPWLEAGDGDCGRRVVRGGSWSGPARLVRSAHRGGVTPGDRDLTLGFRLVQSTRGGLLPMARSRTLRGVAGCGARVSMSPLPGLAGTAAPNSPARAGKRRGW